MNDIWKISTIDNLPGEAWAQIPGYSDNYKASSLGRIKSSQRKCWACYRSRTIKEYIVKQRVNADTPRLEVILWASGSNRVIKPVICLVGQAFGIKAGNGLILTHADGDPFNNQLSNIILTKDPNARRVQFIQENAGLTISQFAEELGISYFHARRLIKDNNLPYKAERSEKAKPVVKTSQKMFNLLERHNWMI